MILSNLNTILKEKNITISDLSFNTKISRPSLTALAQNKSLGINYDTLNSICNVLKITPKEFFIYEPFDVIPLSCKIEGNILTVKVTFEDAEVDGFKNYNLKFKQHTNEKSYVPIQCQENIDFNQNVFEGLYEECVDFIHKTLIDFINQKLGLKIETLNFPVFSILELM